MDFTQIKSRVLAVVWSKLMMLGFLMFIGATMLEGQDGKTLFQNNNCASCHTTGSQRLVGPGLKGISQKYSKEWLHQWIKNPKALVDAGDAEAAALYTGAMPPNPNITDADVDAILAYIDSKNAAAPATAGGDAAPIAIAASPDVAEEDKVLGLTEKAWIYLFLLFTIFTLIGVAHAERRARRFLVSKGMVPWAEESNHASTFGVMLFVACAICFVVWQGISDGSQMLSYMLFAALPYTALIVFIIGTIYRYKMRPFQVSSLSSQFLESKKLFWGVQPFHWGILFLFFGHLIAFLFPRSIVLWNGHPIRLLILEISSFVFGLSALFGLVLLIRRRLTSRRIRVVSNSMDMLVYVVLFVQIVTGLGIALTARWGSSWFATVLSPYLISVFALSPDIAAVSALPWIAQLHIASAFFIIAVIPFSRFVHFLVAPIDYLWRGYQVVIWNWDHKKIRNSEDHVHGKSPKNH